MLRDQADVIDANARRKKDHRHALQNSGRPVSSMLYYSVFIMARQAVVLKESCRALSAVVEVE